MVDLTQVKQAIWTYSFSCVVLGFAIMLGNLVYSLIPRRDGDTENPAGGVRGLIPDKMRYTLKSG